jgi:hypothetical protein
MRLTPIITTNKEYNILFVNLEYSFYSPRIKYKRLRLCQCIINDCSNENNKFNQIDHTNDWCTTGGTSKNPATPTTKTTTATTKTATPTTRVGSEDVLIVFGGVYMEALMIAARCGGGGGRFV